MKTLRSYQGSSLQEISDLVSADVMDSIEQAFIKIAARKGFSDPASRDISTDEYIHFRSMALAHVLGEVEALLVASLYDLNQIKNKP